ncbi:hypothetical protein NDU88_002016, partial [Pleurodeles waltl]
RQLPSSPEPGQSTNRRYNSARKRWMGWCLQRHPDPMGAGAVHIINFLPSLASKGMPYRLVNTFRSILPGHYPIEGSPAGQHPMVCKLLRGIRRCLPHQTCYSSLWDINKVLTLFQKWLSNKYFSRKQMSAKLATLLCFLSCCRVSDVRALALTGRVFALEGVLFRIHRRTKSNSHTISFPQLPQIPKLCIVR